MKTFLSLLTICLLLAITGCDRQPQPAAHSRQAAVEAAVTWYDALLADGYRNLKMNSLAQVATAQMAEKAYYQMAATGEAGLKMDSKLQEITFAPLQEITPNTVTIAAEEEWEYVYWEIKSGKRLFANTVHYSLTYTLSHTTDKWLVADISIQKTKESKDSSFIFQRPPNHPQGGAKN